MTGGITENNQYLTHCERFSLESEKWEKIGEMNVARAGHFMWSDETNNVVYAAGGISQDGGQPLNSIEKFEVSSGRWETLDSKTPLLRYLIP